MMKSLFLAILGVFALSVGFVSCDKISPAATSISFDTLKVDSICPLFKNYDKPACHIVVNMNVPAKQTDEDTRNSIEHFISSLPKDGAFEESAKDAVETMVKNYVSSYIMNYLSEGPDAIDSYGEDMEAAATWMSYEENVEGLVMYNDCSLLSYQVKIFSYTGGAHGNTKTYNGVLDLSTMSTVYLNNIFDELSLNDLNSMLRNKLVAQYECDNLDQLAEKGIFFSPAEIEATENFYVNAEGITWLFDPYDIAPYSVGEVLISLTWDEVYPLLKTKTAVMNLASKQ